MSDTDVHRPWRVQVSDPYSRHLFYRFQVFPARADGVALMSFKNIGCGCAMCTGRHWRRMQRRHDRHEAQRRLRQIVKLTDRGDADVPPPRPMW
jgi:hypothetical protein